MPGILTPEEEHRRLERLAELFDRSDVETLQAVIKEYNDENEFRKRVKRMTQITVWIVGALATALVFREQLISAWEYLLKGPQR